jgi:hypothetical protein
MSRAGVLTLETAQVDKAMQDWLDAREAGTLDELSAPFAKARRETISVVNRGLATFYSSQ